MTARGTEILRRRVAEAWHRLREAKAHHYAGRRVVEIIDSEKEGWSGYAVAPKQGAPTDWSPRTKIECILDVASREAAYEAAQAAWAKAMTRWKLHAYGAPRRAHVRRRNNKNMTDEMVDTRRALILVKRSMRQGERNETR